MNPGERLLASWAEIADLDAAAAALSWDQETYMPPRGQEARGKVLATLAGLRHERITAPALREALEAAAAAAAAEGPVLAAQVREARRRIERAERVPAALAKALAETQSAALAAWAQAREQRAFGDFAPKLRELLALKREEAAAVAPGGDPYDALLDEYEPGARSAALEPLFRSLQEEITPLLHAVAAAGRPVDETPARGEFAPERQLAFGQFLAAQMGFDFAAGRLDASAHPFCSGFAPTDVRLTWRHDPGDFRPALFGILHEAGHGLYEQGLPADWVRTPLGTAVSLGVHESQSRLWENLVGRSTAFWRWALPHFHAAFPGHGRPALARLWPCLHVVAPSRIRVEADQATYNLHIVVRFEIERALLAGRLAVDDLPAAWSGAYERLLGVRPRHDGEGVLQDIHWAMGGFGYFPTYTLGNLIGAQWYAAAARELDLEAQLSRGELRPLRDWLRERVHRHGAFYSADELVARATGRPLTAADFVGHLRAVVGAVYGRAA